MPASDPLEDGKLSPIRLDHISTRMTSLTDLSQFALRYGPAVQRYLQAILRDANAADDVWQELIANLMKRGGPETWPGKGRFRDYLRVSARNAAMSYLRSKSRRPTQSFPEEVAAPADRALDDDWQRCLLEKVWRELDSLERRNSGNYYHTALRIYTEHAESDSKAQAALAAERLGRAVTPEAFRQQVSRGKRQMAEFILIEVAGTIAAANATDVEAELQELGLMRFVRDYLPGNWQTTFFAA